MAERGLLLSWMLLGGLGCGVVAPDHPEITGRVEHHPLASELVGDTYDIYVRLPPDYDVTPDRRFPLVLQLDAYLGPLDEFDTTAGQASDLEAKGRIPATIVVGIGYPYEEAPHKGRWRDFTPPLEGTDWAAYASGGAETYYRFLREELVPFLEEKYRIAGPAGRALFGHSLGGLFATYAFLHYDASAPFVAGFVAASPSLWFDGGTIYDYEEALAARREPMPLILYMTAGTLEGPEINVYLDDFVGRIRAGGYAELRFDAAKFETDHTGSISPSFRRGLRFMFDQGLRGEP